jgi:hypothetical protein
MYSSISIVSGIINLALVIRAVVLLPRLKTPGDPRLKHALKGACSVMLLEVVTVVVRISAFDGLNVTTALIQDVISFFKIWAFVYVGQVLWNRKGIDYWRRGEVVRPSVFEFPSPPHQTDSIFSKTDGPPPFFRETQRRPRNAVKTTDPLHHETLERKSV